MKIRSIILFTLLPMLAISQRNAAIEVATGLNFTNHSEQVLANIEGRLNYDFGVALAMPMKNKHREWSVGLRFMAYGDKYESGTLKWGTQHNGQGGFDSTLPSGESITSISQRSSYYYFELPVALRQYLTSGKTRLFLQASAGPSYFLTGRNQHSTVNVDGSSQNAISPDNAKNFRNVNLFAGLGLGVEFPIGEKLGVQLLSHAQTQLLSITNNSQASAKWHAFGLRGGLRYRLY